MILEKIFLLVYLFGFIVTFVLVSFQTTTGYNESGSYPADLDTKITNGLFMAIGWPVILFFMCFGRRS